MDPTTLFLPGAQALVTAIMTETWGQARAAVAKLWVRRHPGTTAYPDTDSEVAAIERAGNELEAARRQALELAGAGSADDRAARMQLFWAGYLAGQAAARPELAAAIAELPALLGAGGPASRTSTVHNSMSGRAEVVVQAGDINGPFTINR